MRFLLNPVVRSTKAGVPKAGGKGAVVRHSAGATTTTTEFPIKDLHPQKSNSAIIFGQQCSPNCGCVVRFETTVDPSSQIIVSSRYIAKNVIATRDSESGMLKPVLTNKAQKPMFKKCDCQNLHALADKMVQSLPNKSLDRVRNMTEFSSSRASSAFRHAVLAENGLSTKDTHCFDVVEEAFTAMVKGHMPRPRKTRDNYHAHLVKALKKEQQKVDDHTEEPRGTPSEYGSDNGRLSLSSPRAMSTLTMFDINAESWEYEQQYLQQQQQQKLLSKRPRVDSWLSFVDEQYQNEDTG
jgi:hypothetical protein